MAKFTIPKLRKQKTKNSADRAFVDLGGVRHYLGPYGSKVSQEQYGRLIAEWTTNGGRLATDPDSITNVELLAAYWKYAEVYYTNLELHTTSEITCFKYAAKPLKKLYGRALAKDFGPIALKTVRQLMVDYGWSRPYINAQVFRIKRIFKWAVGEELLPASVFQRLDAVPSFKYGRTDAPEPERVQPVADDVIAATVKCLTPTVAAMVTVQRSTGMRPGEVCRMKLSEIDMSKETWVYTPLHHKTKYRGRTRNVYLGPKAQESLRPYLRSGLKGYLFTPEQSERERRTAMHTNRQTPISCGHRPGNNRKPQPAWKAGGRYITAAYARAIAYACQKAYPAPKGTKGKPLKQWHRDHRWSPNQLRHSFATEIRRSHGLEAAQVLLGHAQADVTQVYAEVDTQKAIQVIGKVG